MLTAIIFIYVCVVIWKLTPVVFRALEIRKQFRADVEIRREDMRLKREKEELEASKEAMAEHREHMKKVQESVSSQGRVQYPWVSGIRTNLDTEVNKEFINMRGELAKKDHKAKRRSGIRGFNDTTTQKDLIKKGLDALLIAREKEKKLYEEEGP